MLHRGWIIGLSLAVAAAIALAAEPQSKKTGGLPRLKIDKTAPLLLDASAKKEPVKESEGPVADNSSCFVCHTNYQEEPMAVVHANANVGCVKCHGASLAHRNDEDNITPPDIIFPARKIDAACRTCHDEHNVAAVKVIDRWQKQCPSKTNPASIICTDCHGAEHRLKLRTVQWDKETRQLLGRKAQQSQNHKAAEPKAKAAEWQ